MDVVSGQTQKRTRKLTALRKGDIVNINVLYEENTRDYYNGYKPQEIRGHYFVDRFGNSQKRRMVIYIGRDGENMLFLPLTSQSTENSLPHQYILKDNSMTIRRDPEMKSYVEVECLRAVHISYHRDIPYVGRITKEDMANILHRLSNWTLQFGARRDQRGYVPDDMEEVFQKELAHQGYQLESETDYKKVYAKASGETITRTKYGLVHSHVPVTKEEIYSMVCYREGHDIRTEHRKVPIYPTRRNPMVQRQEKIKNEIRQNRPKGRDPNFPEAVSSLSRQQKKEGGNYVSIC